MKTLENTVVNSSGVFPDTLAVNSTGPATTDGTEFVAGYINNFVTGIAQAVVDYAGITPDGVVEAAGTSQFLEALQKGASYLPGMVHEWNLNVDPATIGFRGLNLNGQGVLRALYTELDTNCYVGDANNAAAHAAGAGYYRADDAAGTIPNIAGVYLIIPESRGYTTRGLDIAASVDPQGAARFLGDGQGDAGQTLSGTMGIEAVGPSPNAPSASGVFGNIVLSNYNAGSALAGFGTRSMDFDSSNSTSPNPAKTDDVETRMSNRSTKYIVIY